MSDRPLVDVRPAPRRMERIFTPEAKARLFRDHEVVQLGPNPTGHELDTVLPSPTRRATRSRSAAWGPTRRTRW